MAQTILVEAEISAGLALIDAFNSFAPVTVALWMKPEDSSEPYLYIASKKFDESGVRAGYIEINRLTEEVLQNPMLGPFQVKLISDSSRLALEASAIQQKRPVGAATVYRGSSLGMQSIDWAYIYPLPETANSAKVQSTSP